MNGSFARLYGRDRSIATSLHSDQWYSGKFMKIMYVLCPCRVCLFDVDAQVGKGFLRLFGVKFTVSGQPRERRSRNGLGVDLKVPAQMLAIVAASETVG